jgi:hypothetical protein
LLLRTAVLVAAASVALLVGSAPAGAAPERISGRLSEPGYSVLALAADGKTAVVRVRGRRFELRPPARRVTLHLRAKDGTYAGPIVIGRAEKGKVAIVGVRAGAPLGRIEVGRGYGRLASRLPGMWIDSTRAARAKRGVPIGARRSGLVRSRGARGPRSDRDLDGIPSPLDIDDDGDRILDNLDRSGTARVGASQVETPELGIATFLPLGLPFTTNVHAVDRGLGWIDLNFSQMARLGIGILPGDQAELDCGGSPDPGNPDGWIGGLSYCVRGGTGGHFVVPDPTPGDPFDWPPFPESQDPDGDGFGTLQPGSGGGMFLVEATTTEKVRGGEDLLVERVTTNGVETPYSATLQYVFNTIPALVSYQDGTMSSPQAIPYPVEFGQPGTRPEDGFPVSDGPEDADSDVELTFTFWRPQRQRMSGDPGEGEWMDIGGLTYTVQGFFAGGQFCGPQTAYSTEDPNLMPAPPEILGTDQKGLPGGGFTERPAPDRPADRANTLTFTVNLSECLRAQGVSFNPGDSVPLALTAISAAPNFVHDQAEQQFHVKRR